MTWPPRYAACNALRPPPKAMPVGALLTPTTVVAANGPVARWLSAIGAAFAVLAFYVWDDALLAAPIIAMTGLVGPAAAFAVLASVFTLVSFLLSMVGLQYSAPGMGQIGRRA